MGTMKQSGQWRSLGTHGPLVITWWLCISGSGETGNIDTFQVEFDLEGQGQSPPNLVIPAWTGDELWCGQAQNGVNLDFYVKFDLEGHGPSLHKTTGALTNVFCTFDPNLVILASTDPELSCGQASDWYTDWQTHRCRQQQHPKAKTGRGQ